MVWDAGRAAFGRGKAEKLSSPGRKAMDERGDFVAPLLISCSSNLSLSQVLFEEIRQMAKGGSLAKRICAVKVKPAKMDLMLKGHVLLMNACLNASVLSNLPA